MRLENMDKTVMEGLDWSTTNYDIRELHNKVEIKDQVTGEYKVVDYSPEILELLESDDSFSGLAYSDVGYDINTKGVNKLYYRAIYDGKIKDEETGELVDVNDSQVVAKWDLITSDGGKSWLSNNKLEAEGFLDYAKIFVRSPLNMMWNMADSLVFVGRAGMAAGYGGFNLLSGNNTDVRDNEAYKYLTKKGIQIKGQLASSSKEAMDEGFFGSLEMFLATVSDVAIQVQLAQGLSWAGRRAAKIVGKNLDFKDLAKLQAKYSERTVRSTLTLMATKDSYNESIENGFTTTEASMISAATFLAMWQATRLSSYVYADDFQPKLFRKKIKETVMREELLFLRKIFPKMNDSEKGRAAINVTQNAISKFFGKATGVVQGNQTINATVNEALEEFAEELGQDGVKHVASAYGHVVNGAMEAGKGRFSTFMDDGWLRDASLRYRTSFVAGGIGGAIGVIGHKVDVSDISDANTFTDIITLGGKDQLVASLDRLRADGKLGPTTLSVEYNDKLDVFEPLIKGTNARSLSDMVYDTFMKDIETVDMFMNRGLFGAAKHTASQNTQLKNAVDDNAMRKDYAALMGDMIEFHGKTGISSAVYTELDEMTEARLHERLEGIIQTSIEKKIASNKSEIEALEKNVASDATTTETTEEGDAPSKKKKRFFRITPKKKVVKEAESDKDIISRLEAEIKFSSTVTNEQVSEMLEKYRRVRAIANGTAAEYYYMTNKVINNPILGDKKNRTDEFLSLGNEPVKDILFAARNRAADDEKIHLININIANAVEKKILAFEEVDDSNIKELDEYIIDNGHLLTQDALAHLASFSGTLDFSALQEKFDVNSPNSMFRKDKNGMVDRAHMFEVFKALTNYQNTNKTAFEDANEAIDLVDHGLVDGFFKSMATDIRAVNSSLFFRDEDGRMSVEDGTGPAPMDVLNEIGSPEIVNALKSEPSYKYVLRNIADTASAEGTAMFDPTPIQITTLDVLLRKKGKGNFLTTQKLVDVSLSSVRDMLDRSIPSSDPTDPLLIPKMSTLHMDELIKEIKVQEAVSDFLKEFTPGSVQYQSNLGILADYRKNITNILDFKYDVGESASSTIENHAYKDYSILTDHFVDFMYDQEAMRRISETDESQHTPEDKNALKRTIYNTRLLRGQILTKEKETDKPSTVAVTINEVQLKAFLDKKFNNLQGKKDIERAIAFIEDKDPKLVPLSVLLLEE